MGLGRLLSHDDLAVDVARRADELRREPAWLIGERTDDIIAHVLARMQAGAPTALVNEKSSQAERELLRSRIDLGQLPPRAAIVIFTSGSSGEPKGVVLSAEAFAASAAAHTANLGWRDDDRWLCNLSLAHIAGLSIITRSYAAGRDIVVAGSMSFEPAQLIAMVDDHRVTLLSLVPTMLSRVVDELPDWQCPGHVRAVLLGGAAATPALVERARARGVPVLPTYGMTETCSQIYTGGNMLAGVDVRTTNGRLQVRGPMLAMGYIDQDGFRPLTDDGWFDTGDLGRVDDNGRLRITGRADDCIISGGANVFPAEVERVVQECADVAAACVFGVSDDTWGQLVAVAIVPASHDDDAARRVAEFIRARLASYKQPRRIAVVDELPLGDTGKVDRRRVAQLATARLAPLET